MMSGGRLKGMTWNHPRGYDPMVACSALWRQKAGVGIDWDKRSLQDFESFSVEELAQHYDLIVIDHPHVGRVTAGACLAPLDDPARASELSALAAASVGPSFASYTWQGRQWALPIDAAAQVVAWHPDWLAAPPTEWREVLDLARQGVVLLPLRPPHSLMCFFTLAANLGRPCAVDTGAEFADPEIGGAALDAIRELAALVDPTCLEMDPIAVLDRMSAADAGEALSPLIYGYVSYSVDGFRPHPIAFADLAALGSSGPVGSAIGGTGIAVSAFSTHREQAIDFAYWLAGGAVQSGAYWSSGGQPAHADAWESEAANHASRQFYRATRQTLDRSWLRPRHAGTIGFQETASAIVNDAVTGRLATRTAIERLNDAFLTSFAD